MTAEEKADAIQRNVAHLEIMVAKDFWTNRGPATLPRCDCRWRMKVLIATPAHDGRLDVWYTTSLVNSVRIAQENGIFCTLSLCPTYDAGAEGEERSV
jgi:hypothetical protein